MSYWRATDCGRAEVCTTLARIDTSPSGSTTSPCSYSATALAGVAGAGSCAPPHPPRPATIANALTIATIANALTM
jgi:hypothetical protein